MSRNMETPATVRTVPKCVPIVPLNKCNNATMHDTFVSCRFESPEEAFAYAELPIPRSTGFTTNPASKKKGSWMGYDNWEAYRTAVRTGDSALLNQARAIQDELEKTETFLHLYGKGEEQAWDVCGASVDVGAFVDGEPECMIAYDETGQGLDPTVLKMGVHTGALSNVSPANMLARSVGIAALIDLIESRGVRVELWSIASASTGTYQHSSMIKIKAPEQSMALERLALFCGHASMHRRLNFSLRERDPQSVLGRMCTKSESYGHTVEASMEIQKEFDLYLPHITRGNSYPNAASIADWIEAVLQANTICRDILGGE